jgi:hypothetical protein
MTGPHRAHVANAYTGHMGIEPHGPALMGQVASGLHKLTSVADFYPPWPARRPSYFTSCLCLRRRQAGEPDSVMINMIRSTRRRRSVELSEMDRQPI